MMWAGIIAAGIIFLGIVAHVWGRLPGQAQARKKEKKERPAPVESPKDVVQVSERFERRIRSLENNLQLAQGEQRDKLKEIEGLKAAQSGLERQIDQEKAWREKAEALSVKEKKEEDGLRIELEKTRELLNGESNQRIRLEYELKELRLAKDALSADVRKLTGQNNEFDRRVKEVIAEARELKVENAKLKVRKESDAWVAKDDFVKIEGLLKRTRQEMEQMQKRGQVDALSGKLNEKG